MLDNISKGQIGEARFITECIKRGIKVSKPFSTQSRYDFVSDYNGVLKKVQVKSASGIPIVDFRKSGRSNYRACDVDVFAVITHGAWYLIPFEIVKDKYKMQFTKNGLNKKYKNKWELLKS